MRFFRRHSSYVFSVVGICPAEPGQIAWYELRHAPIGREDQPGGTNIRKGLRFATAKAAWKLADELNERTTRTRYKEQVFVPNPKRA